MAVQNSIQTFDTNLLADESGTYDYLHWNAIYSARDRLLYIPTPKAACTSIKWWFAGLLGLDRQIFSEIESVESDSDLVIHDTLHKVAPQGAACVELGFLSEALLNPAVYKFAIVRNPYQRIFSAWQSKLLLREPLQSAHYENADFFNLDIRRHEDIVSAFEGFLEYLVSEHDQEGGYHDPHWTPQVALLHPKSIPYSRVSQIEDTRDLLKELAEHLDLQRFSNPFKAKRTNESLIPYSAAFFSARAAELIRSLYREDFETFGYSDVLPAGKSSFDAGQLDVAIKAIKMIKGRHQRIKELNASLEERKVAALRQEGELADAQSRLSSVSEHALSMQRELDAYMQQSSACADQVRAAETCLRESAENTSLLQRELQAYELQAVAYADQIRVAERRMQEMALRQAGELADAQSRLSSVSEHALSMQRELDAYMQQSSACADQVRAAETCLRESAENTSLLQRELQAYELQAVAYADQIRVTERHMQEMADRIAELQQNAIEQTALRSNIQNLEAQVLQLKQSRDELLNLHQTAESRHAQLVSSPAFLFRQFWQVILKRLRGAAKN